MLFTSRIRGFLREGRRRKVYTAGAAYLALSFALIEFSDPVFEALLLPDFAHRLLTILLLLGFPVVVVLAWIFDLGPAGVQRTDGLLAGSPHAGPAEQSAAGHASARGGGLAGAASKLSAPPPAAPFPSRSAPPLPPRALERRAPATPPDPDAEPAQAPEPERVRRAALAHVRHELKTPINAIIGYSEMLVDDATESGRAELVPDLRRIRAAGAELLTLVESILNPDHPPEAGQAPELESYGARIRADLRNPINAVIGYAELLVESSRESGGDALVPDLERIRAAANRLLELSNDIVRLATGVEGQAARDTLSGATSVAEGVLAKIRPLGGSPDAAERQGALLVVDDNALNRDLVSRQLARKGYQVATAEHGQEALERLEQQPIDLVLLDVLMPEMDGVETLRRIKSQPRLREIPVIMMSSLDEIDSAIRCMELGADDYLTKPVHPTLLDVRIGASLEVRRLREREDFYRSQLDQGSALVGRLLRSLVPDRVADRLQAGETDVVDAAAETSVLWCDLSRSVPGGPLVEPAVRAAAVRRLVAALEEQARQHEIETVVIGDASVLLVSGLPTPVPNHAERVAAAAAAALAAARSIAEETAVSLRFGMHTGAAAAAVIGGDRLAYQIWGDAVELARRLEAQAEPGTVHVSPAAQALLKEKFDLSSRGVIEIAGRGQMRTFGLSAAAVPAGG